MLNCANECEFIERKSKIGKKNKTIVQNQSLVDYIDLFYAMSTITHSFHNGCDEKNAIKHCGSNSNN